MSLKRINNTGLIIILSFFTFLLVIVPYIIFGFADTLPPPWYNFPLVMNIVIWMPITTAIFFVIYDYLIRQTNRSIRFLYITGIIMFIWGHGAHWAANVLNRPPMVSYIAYYIDEILTHLIMYIGFLTIFLIISFLSPMIQEDIIGGWKTTILASIIFSLSSTFIAVETKLVNMFIIASIIILIYHFSISRGEVGVTTLQLYYISWSIFQIAFLIIYYYIFGGFIPPSELI